MISRSTGNPQQTAPAARARALLLGLALPGCGALSAHSSSSSVVLSSGPLPGAIPEWLAPLRQPDDPVATAAESGGSHLAGTPVTYLSVELKGLFLAPDWHLQPHTPRPPLVAGRRAPEVRASGYCHTPSDRECPDHGSRAFAVAAGL